MLGSVLTSGAALAIPEGYSALLGVVPLILGVRQLRELIRARGTSETEKEQAEAAEQKMDRRTHPQVLAVAGVRVANGGSSR